MVSEMGINMKIAVVTGASSGLGREFAKQIAARYSRFDEIWLVARRTERLEEVAAEIKLTSRVISLDLSSIDELSQFKGLLEENTPDIKLLVNCAGYGRSGSFEELDCDAVSYTHLRAHETDSYLVCRLLLEKKNFQSGLQIQ